MRFVTFSQQLWRICNVRVSCAGGPTIFVTAAVLSLFSFFASLFVTVLLIYLLLRLYMLIFAFRVVSFLVK